MTIRQEFLEAMSEIISSVAIVTTDGPAGRKGATISAMTSVSADGDTPTMLICLHHEATATAATLENKCFCINVLHFGQDSLANIFASRAPAPGGDKFLAGTFVAGGTGAPRLSDALASFECKLLSHERIGTHHVMIGAVQSIQRSASAEETPLLYGNRRYTCASPPD